jgi:hypothetical protein
MNPSRKRPYQVAGAAWIMTALGAWVTVAAVGGAIARTVVGNASPDATIPGWSGLEAYPFEVATAQVGLGILTLICARAVFKGSRRTRRASQMLMLVWTILLLGTGLWMASWHPPGSQGEGVSSSVLALFWKGAAVINAIIFAALPALAAWLLGRETAQQWFQRQ